VLYSWTQVIPANQVVEITQFYSPVVGGGYFSVTNNDSGNVANYCATAETTRAIAALKAQAAESKDTGTLLYEQAIDFTLTSANGWSGPIGIFHLTVLTKDPNDMLITCMPGLQRVAPTKFVLEKDNFQPSEELKLMVLQKSRPWGW
ncbi:MAG TPA: DUF4424 family protein, partial [Candidatus Acidoferrales bacterium]|nr:DUF4424 family protein [Candidatus Acidoferrales bacterium]